MLRDAYMSGYSQRAFDLDRLLRYSLFTNRGLTIHERGLSALERFIAVRGDLFRSVYYHRTVRAIDLTLAGTVRREQGRPLPRQPTGTPRRVLAVHRVVAAGPRGRLASLRRPAVAGVGPALAGISLAAAALENGLRADGFFRSRPARRGERVQRRRGFAAADPQDLPPELKDIVFRIDIPRHVYRPEALAPTADQNFLLDPATGRSIG